MSPNWTLNGLTYAFLVGVAFIFTGMLVLGMWIPRLKSSSHQRTDLYLAQCSTWFIKVGLCITLMWATAFLVVRSLLMLKSVGIIR